MANKESKTIWRVNTRDKNFPGSNKNTFLLRGPTAASVEPKALKLAKTDTMKGEPKSSPYILSIELIGELDD